MKNFRKFVSEQYVYHRSDEKNHESIKKHGIIGQQLETKKGAIKTAVNFASSIKDTEGYADGPSKLYRVKIKDLKDAGKDRFSGYVRTDHDVHPDFVEYQHGKKWKKL